MTNTEIIDLRTNKVVPNLYNTEVFDINVENFRSDVEQGHLPHMRFVFNSLSGKFAYPYSWIKSTKPYKDITSEHYFDKNVDEFIKEAKYTFEELTGPFNRHHAYLFFLCSLENKLTRITKTRAIQLVLLRLQKTKEFFLPDLLTIMLEGGRIKRTTEEWLAWGKKEKYLW